MTVMSNEDPADPSAHEKCPTCGSDCNERDELTKAEREIERLRNALEEIADGLQTWTAEGMAHLAREALGPNVRGKLHP